MPGSRVDALSAISHPSNAQVASWEVGIARRRACLVGRASSSALRSFRGLARRSGLFRSLPFSKRRKRCGRNCAKMRLPSREGFKVSPAIAAYSGLIRSLSLSKRRKSCGRNCAKTRFPVVGDASRSALRSLRTRGFFAPFPCPSELGPVRERKSPATSWLGFPWRRGRDSNPRYLAVKRFSRPPRSTTLPPLRSRPRK